LPQLFPKQEAKASAAAPSDPFAQHLRAAFAFAEKGPDVIDVHEAKKMLDAGVPVLDVRNPDEFVQERIAEARNLPLPALSRARRTACPLTPRRRSSPSALAGSESLYGLLLLKAQGYQIVKSVAGGMGAWVNAACQPRWGAESVAQRRRSSRAAVSCIEDCTFV